MNQEFMPSTRVIDIGDGICYRPIKSWHSATYAGEGLYKIPETNDGSGCLRIDSKLCNKPLTVTHRLYWNVQNPNKTFSVFLSYPNGMGACNNYFWEAYPAPNGDVERWIGPNAEIEMETAIKDWLK